jgi:predicted DNA-binding ribbon-helix-helix protein
VNGEARTGRPRKRSLDIAGHRTSVSVEDEFWDELGRIAGRRGISVPQLIARIDQDRADQGRGAPNLSSAIRLYVLEVLKSEAG